MIDLYHYIGGDLSLSPTGDLTPVSDTEKGKQRVLRRLLTNPQLEDADGNIISAGDYVFHPDYGAGLARKVGDIVNINEWTALIRGQMLLEDCVARSPEPVITVSVIDQGASVDIQYTDAVSGLPTTLSFDVTR
jgi:hypothetical protein